MAKKLKRLSLEEAASARPIGIPRIANWTLANTKRLAIELGAPRGANAYVIGKRRTYAQSIDFPIQYYHIPTEEVPFKPSERGR